MKRLKNLSLTLMLLTIATTGIAQGHRISIQVKPATKGYLFLGYYFGEKKLLQDSARIGPDGIAIFEGKDLLPGGLYIIVNNTRSRYFDVIIDKEQRFNMSVDSSFDANTVVFKNSQENLFLKNYQQVSNEHYQRFAALQQQLAAAKTKGDSTQLQENMMEVNKTTQQWRDNFILEHADSYLALLFQLLKEPEYKLPEGKTTRNDTALAYYQYKQAFWKDISLGDERLLRTPMFEARLNRYMEQVVIKNVDSIKKEVDKFILSSRGNKTMFRYYVTRFTNDYMNPKYMGQDAVFLHLFEKYYLTNQVDWLEEKDKEVVYNRAYNLMGNIVGEPAGNMNLLDTSDFMFSLYNIQAPYMLLVFWDPDCGHCREEVPKLDSMYRNNWKQQGLRMLGVLMDSIRTDYSKVKPVKENWMKFIREKGLEGWYHGYQTPQMRDADSKANRPGIRQLYDVYQTPTLYLIDKDKKIIAKKITLEQADEIFQAKLNQADMIPGMALHRKNAYRWQSFATAF